MFVRGFGEIEVVWENLPEGLLLRDINGVVHLEQRFDDEGINVDVLHQFKEEVTLKDEEYFCECIAVAREYEPDWNVPIYIQSLAARYKEDEQEQKKRREYYETLIQRSRTHPWRYWQQ